MHEAVQAGHRHAIRELKSGTLGLVEACTLDECADERLLDLIGFSLIGCLPDKLAAGQQALRISAKLNVGPYLYAYQAPPDLVVACAAAIAEASIDERYAARPPRQARRRWWHWFVWGIRTVPVAAAPLLLSGCQAL